MTLSEYLHERGETVTHFARRIETSRVSVSRIIHGKQTPGSQLIKRIHAATDGAVTANDLLHEVAA